MFHSTVENLHQLMKATALVASQEAVRRMLFAANAGQGTTVFFVGDMVKVLKHKHYVEWKVGYNISLANPEWSFKKKKKAKGAMPLRHRNHGAATACYWKCQETGATGSWPALVR